MSRYSQLYTERGKATADSQRFRTRIAGYMLRTLAAEQGYRSAGLLHQTLGIDVPAGAARTWLGDFFRQAELRDVLDAITVVRSAVLRGSRIDASEWRSFVVRAAKEENLAYRIDDDCVVHPYVDSEFEANRASALEALADPKFGEARNDFEAAFRHLRNGEGKQAIRMMFPAVETAVKVLFPGRVTRLEVTEVDRQLVPAMVTKYTGNQPAIDAGRRLLDGFKDWIIASHPYRHGQEIQEATDLPRDLVVAHLSAGATYLRWTIEIST